jgi:hypothetical protein
VVGVTPGAVLRLGPGAGGGVVPAAASRGYPGQGVVGAGLGRPASGRVLSLVNEPAANFALVVLKNKTKNVLPNGFVCENALKLNPSVCENALRLSQLSA